MCLLRTQREARRVCPIPFLGVVTSCAASVRSARSYGIRISIDVYGVGFLL